MKTYSRATGVALLLLLIEGCTRTAVLPSLRSDFPSQPANPKVLAVYEPWFGHPRHISVGYSSHDPAEIRRQIDAAKNLGISGFVIDWYGDREPFLDQSYALLQSIAAEKNFKVAMMYDESNAETGRATDDALAAFDKFNRTYLASTAPGREAYLMYRDRPVVFIFPKGGHTDWKQVRESTESWNPSPLLLYADRRTPYADHFDGFYAWVNPGKRGWDPGGRNWGGDYLQGFYQRMQARYPDKIAVGAAWAGFDDRRASWSLGRYMSQRCGKTFSDTLALAQEHSTPNRPMPFLLIVTWNDYEEGTAIERGLAKCKSGPGQDSGN